MELCASCNPTVLYILDYQPGRVAVPFVTTQRALMPLKSYPSNPKAGDTLLLENIDKVYLSTVFKDTFGHFMTI